MFILSYAVTTLIGQIFPAQRSCMKAEDALLNTQVSVPTLKVMFGGSPEPAEIETMISYHCPRMVPAPSPSPLLSPSCPSSSINC